MAPEVWLRLTFGRSLSVARYEQDVGGAFDKSGARSVGLLEPLEFIEKLIVDCQEIRGLGQPRAATMQPRSRDALATRA